MTQPRHHSRHAARCGAHRYYRPVDHQNRQPQGTGGGDLGNGPLSSGVLGHDNLDTVVLHQGCVCGYGERPARHHDIRLRQGQGAGRRVNQTQQVMVLWLGCESIDMLSANGKEHPPGRAGKGCNRSPKVGEMGPAVTFACLPWRAFQSDQWNASGSTSGNRIAAHSRGEGVGRVDHMGDGFGGKVVLQLRNPAKAAHPHVDRLAHRGFGAPGIGVDPRKPRCGNGLGHEIGFGGAAQQKYACHE